MQEILLQVDRIVSYIGAKVEVSDCNNNGFNELKKKLYVVERYVIANKSVTVLEDCVKDLKLVCGEKTKVEKDDEREDFKDCKSIKDIENAGEFEYKLEEEAVMCTVCEKKAAGYAADQEDNFHGKAQSMVFVHLKETLKKHLTRGGHLEKMKERRVRSKLEEKTMSRDKRVGAVLGAVSYYLLKKGRPQEDYTTLVNLLSRAGVDVGDINHSFKFVAKFAPAAAEVVKGRVSTYFQTALVQTGRRPPVKILADKATWKHRTRMVSGLVTVVPDTPVLLQTFFLASKSCPGGTGDAMTESLVGVMEGLVDRSQYLGISADGATLHCNVGRKLGEHFKKRVHDDYDPLHKAGLVHVHMVKDKQYQFVNNVTENISAVYRMFNMGQEFAHFFEVAKELAVTSGNDLEFKMPRFFSETRFPNYASIVLDGFKENYPALIKSLAELEEAGLLDTATANDLKKADQAAGLLILIHCLEFVFLLCAICDLYTHFGKSVNVLQIVNILPHEKFDLFEEGCRDKLKEMVDSVAPQNCPCSLVRNMQVIFSRPFAFSSKLHLQPTEQEESLELEESTEQEVEEGVREEGTEVDEELAREVSFI